MRHHSAELMPLPAGSGVALSLAGCFRAMPPCACLVPAPCTQTLPCWLWRVPWFGLWHQPHCHTCGSDSGTNPIVTHVTMLVTTPYLSSTLPVKGGLLTSFRKPHGPFWLTYYTHA
eukprot:363451-Chlamydomonas_euryale.AAC.16